MVAKGTVTISVYENPVDENDCRTLELPCTKQLIADLQSQYVGPEGSVWLNGRSIPQEEADATRVTEGDHLCLGVGVGAEVGFAIAMMIASTMVSMVVSSLMPEPDQPSLPDIDTGAAGWHPRTKQQAGLPLPYMYGKNRRYGNIISATTTLNDDLDETAHFTVAWGAGPMKGPVADTLLIDGQSLDNFTDTTVESRNGTLNQTACTSVTSNTVEYSLSGREVFETGSTYTTPDDDFEDLEIVLEVPYGLPIFPGRGYNGFVDIKIELSVADADSWITLVNEVVYSDSRARFVKHYKASETYLNGTPISIVRGNQYDIRVTKSDHTWYRAWTGPGWMGQQYQIHDPEFDLAAYKATYGAGSASVFLEFQADPATVRMFSVTEIFATAESNNLQTFPGVAYSAVNALWTGQFSGSINVSEVWEGRIVHVYDGVQWVWEYSANPAWVLWDLLTLPVLSGDGITEDYVVERYYGVQAESQLAFWESFYEAAQYWDTDLDDGRGGTEKFTFNGTFDRETTVWDAIQKVCEVCSCNLIYQGTGYRLLVDKAETFCQIFTDDNTIDGTLEQQSFNSNVVSEINAHFWDVEADYEKTAILATNQSINTTISTTMDLLGITSEGNASRILNRRLLHNQYTKSSVKFEAGRDALNLTEGSVIFVQNVCLESADSVSAMVYSVASTSSLVMDRDLEDTSNITTCVIRTSSDNGEDAVTFYSVSSISGRTLTIQGTFDYTPVKGDILALGPAVDLSRQWRVTALDRNDDFTTTIMADEYHAEVYAYDSAEPTVAIASHTASSRPRPLNNLMTQGHLVNSLPATAIQMDAMATPFISNVTWTGNGTTTVTWAATDTDNPIRVYYKGTEYMIAPDSTTSAWIYWGITDPYEFQAATSKTGIDPTTGEFLLAGNVAGTCKLFMGTGVVENLGDLAELDTVDTDEIEDEAVIVGTEAYSASAYGSEITTSWVTVQSTAVAVVTGFGEFVHFVWTLEFDNYVAAAVDMDVQVLNGSTMVAQYLGICTVPASLYIGATSMGLDASLTTGTKTYNLQVRKASSAGEIYVSERALGAKLWKGK